MHFITASDGVRIAYEEEGSGPPLLMLHGLMANRAFFKHQLSLAQDFRLIRPDLRGHGDSPAPAASLSVEQIAADIAELADHLDLRGAIAIGWSLGASVLWHVLAGPASHRFAGAVIVDMTPRVLNDDEWVLGLSGEVCAARRDAIDNDFKSFAAHAGQAIFAQPVDEALRAEAAWASEQFANNDAKAMASLWSSLAEQDFRPTLARIRQPTLIVHGAQSHLYGSGTAEHLAAALPEAATIQFDRSGHSPHLEEPEHFNHAIRDFAGRLLKSQATA